jgi:hypothetical protein
MAQRKKRDGAGGITESPGEATQADNSTESFDVLTVSLILAVIAGLCLFWYFGIFPFGTHVSVPPG